VDVSQDMSELQRAVDVLYDVFRRHRLRRFVPMCQDCHSPSQNDLLHSAPLRVLSPEAFTCFPGCALSLFGELPDWKHFLPRLLELVSMDGLGADPVLRTLRRSAWRAWPMHEQLAVERWLRAWFAHRVGQGYDRQLVSDLRELGHLVGDLRPFGSLWLELEGAGPQRSLAAWIWYRHEELDWLPAGTQAQLEERFFAAGSADLESELSRALEVLSAAEGAKVAVGSSEWIERPWT
jgi:hypothetical protein